MTAPEPTGEHTPSLAERVARARWNTRMAELTGKSWDQLESAFQEGELVAADGLLRILEAARLAVVELPEPDEVHETGNFVTARFGPVAIRSDGFLRRMDSLGYTAREKAVYLLAAARWAEHQGGDPR